MKILPVHLSCAFTVWSSQTHHDMFNIQRNLYGEQTPAVYFKCYCQQNSCLEMALYKIGGDMYKRHFPNFLKPNVCLFGIIVFLK